MRNPVITPDEARVIWDVLNRMWIPKDHHDEFLSALAKLEAIATSAPAPPPSLVINVLT